MSIGTGQLLREQRLVRATPFAVSETAPGLHRARADQDIHRHLPIMNAPLKAKLSQLHGEIRTAKTPNALLAIATRWRDNHRDESVIVATAISAVAHSTGLILDGQWKQYDESAESLRRPNSRKDRALAVLYSIWSAEIVDHYGWSALDRDFLESLALLARKCPKWKETVMHFNSVMLARHIRSIHESKFKKIGEHHPQCRLKSPLQPLLHQDVQSILQRFSGDYTRSESTISEICGADIESWVNLEFDGQETLKGVTDGQLVHYFLKFDDYRMLIPISMSTAQEALRKRKRSLESNGTRVQRTTLTNLQTYLRPSQQPRNSQRVNAAAKARIISQSNRSPTTRPRDDNEPRLSTNEDPRTTSDKQTSSSSPSDSSLGCEHDDFSCDSKVHDLEHSSIQKPKKLPRPCCAGFGYQPPFACDEKIRTAFRWAQRRHEQLYECSTEGSRICDPYLGWLANAELARAGIDYFEIDAAALQEQLLQDPKMSTRIPLLVQENFRDKQGYSNRDFIERMMLCMTSGSLEVILPFNDPSRCRMSAKELEQTLTVPIPGLNALSMANYIGALPPTLMTIKRFEWLSTILCALQVADNRAADKNIDVRECLRFDLYACEGAFSGAHLDSLCGTWIRPISGEEKAWMFILGDKMEKSDWDEFESLAHNYIPRPGLARLLFLPVGCAFIMPPGIPVVHAVGTNGTSVNTGGMFWDKECIVDTLRNINRITSHQNFTNEPLQLDLARVIDMMAQLVERNKPEVWADDDFQAELETFRRLRCDCRGQCSRTTCECIKGGRRCTRACSRHSTGKMCCFTEDRNTAS